MFLDRRNDRDRTSLVPFFLGLARHRRRSRILDLDPAVSAARAIRGSQALRHDALAAERAGVLVDDCAVAAIVLVAVVRNFVNPAWTGRRLCRGGEASTSTPLSFLRRTRSAAFKAAQNSPSVLNSGGSPFSELTILQRAFAPHSVFARDHAQACASLRQRLHRRLTYDQDEVLSETADQIWAKPVKSRLRNQCGRRKVSFAGRWRSCSSANTVMTLRSIHARYATSSILGSRAWKCRSRPCSDRIVKPQKSPKRS